VDIEHGAKAMRAQAEAAVQTQFSILSNSSSLTPEETRALLHELGVHQVQLEMQNEELRNVQMALEDSRARYLDLYDFAPVGHCSVNENGVIFEANLTLTSLLGVPRTALIGKPFNAIILSADQDSFYVLKKQLQEDQALSPQVAPPTHTIELRLKGRDGEAIWVSLLAAQTSTHGRKQLRLVITDVSEKKLADASLRVSDVALKSISQGVIMTGVDQRIEWVNAAFSAITGYASSEILGQNCKFLQGPETDPLMVNAIRLAIKNNTEFAGEILNYRKMGTAFWNELTISPVFDTQGTRTHYIGVTRDVTARRMIEKANQEFTMQLRLAIRGADIGFWDWNIASNGLTVNDRWLQMLGLNPQAQPFSIKQWHALIHPEDVPKLTHLFESVILNPHGTSGEAEIRARHRAGHYVWILSRFSVVDRASDGKPLRVVGTHLDITEQILAETARREANSELRRSEELLRNIIDSTAAHIFAVDLQQRFTVANFLMAKDFGQTTYEIVGKTLHEVLPHEMAEALLAVNRQIISSGEAKTSEEVIPGPSGGAARVMSTTMFPLHNALGEIVGVGGVATEITQRKQMEDLL